MRKAPLPQAGSRMVSCKSHSRYSLNRSNDRFRSSFCRKGVAPPMGGSEIASMSNSRFFSAQSLPMVCSTMYLVMCRGV
ncbi:MAG: hypothetical protein IJK87_00505 [Prevotella sp.]|nr:hypothetical protein [Prevotella sp.]